MLLLSKRCKPSCLLVAHVEWYRCLFFTRHLLQHLCTTAFTSRAFYCSGDAVLCTTFSIVSLLGLKSLLRSQLLSPTGDY